MAEESLLEGGSMAENCHWWNYSNFTVGGNDSILVSASGSTRIPVEMEEDANRVCLSLGMEGSAGTAV